MIIVLAMLACRIDTQHEGTIVGNPGDAKGKLAEGEGVEFYSAIGIMESILLRSQQQEQLIELDFPDGDFDLLQPEESVSIPAGEWDSMSIVYQEISIYGNNLIDDIDFDILLEDVEIELDGQKAFDISEGNYILELARPAWLTSDLLMTIEGEEEVIFIGSDSVFYDEVFGSVIDQTGLFIDSNGDGEIDIDEREEQNVAYTTATADELEASDTGLDGQGDTGSTSKTVSTCGCHDSSMSYVLLPIFLLGLLRRREETI